MKSVFTRLQNKKMISLVVSLFLYGATILNGFAQGRISGTVEDETGMMLPGVTVLVTGTTTGVVTDIDGKFDLALSPGATRLTFSYIGYLTQQIEIGSQSVLNIVLLEDSKNLDEVVVTALGVQRERKELGYTVQALKADELITTQDNNIVNALSGKVAGVQVTSSGSQIGASSRIIIRGNASFAGNQPLFVVDGVPIDNTSTNLGGSGGLDYGNAAADIDPESIESLTVLKGANAAALYGNRAANGVILIETKKGKKAKEGLGVEFNSSMVFDVPSYFMNFQNEYGIGSRGAEYDWQQYLQRNPTSTLNYNAYAKQFGYNYVNGIGGGVNENATAWGPRFDSGLLLDQWIKGPNSPWQSDPDNIQDNYFQTATNFINQIAVTARGKEAYGRVAFSNRKMEGNFFNTDQTVNTLNANLTLTPHERLTVGTNFNYVNRKSDNIPVVSYGSMTKMAWGAFRNIPLDEVKKVYNEFENEMGSGYNRKGDKTRCTNIDVQNLFKQPGNGLL